MAEKGGVTILLFHCFFNEHESITSFMHSYDNELYNILPNTYAVCVAYNSVLPRKIPAGFFVKTSYTHDDKDFVNALFGLVATTNGLNGLSSKRISFLPARIGVDGPAPLTEREMLRIMATQNFKYSTSEVVQ